MWELDYKESWVPNNWCFWTVVLEKTLESPLDCKEIQPVHPKGNQSWMFIGRIDVEAETPTADVKSHLMRRADSFEKILMLGKIGGGRRRGDRGWDGWMASLTQWAWSWVNSGSWWCTGRPGVLRFMGSQRVEHDWATELNWCMLSHFICVRLFATPRTVACQAPLSMGFSRQEYWSGFPFPTPGDLPDPGVEPMSLISLALGSLPLAPPAKPPKHYNG